MRQSVIVIGIMLFLLSACGGSSDGTGARPGPVPSGSVSGVAHDGVLNGSTITVRSYATGAVLGTATTDVHGNYSVSVQTEETSLLIEATGGFYLEEASGIRVTLGSGQSLRAAVNFSPGSAVTAQVTPFTNLAAGLAAYRISQGTGVAAAIDSANQEISTVLDFSIINTVPLDITDTANVSAFVSNGILYGFMSASISSWTKFASEASGDISVHRNFNSIALAQTMYADIVADGILNGRGFNAAGELVPLSFGALQLNQGVYRFAFAAHIMKIVNDTTVNKTTLTATALQPIATGFAENTDGIWGGVTPLPFVNNGRPIITLGAVPWNHPVWFGTYSDGVGIHRMSMNYSNGHVQDCSIGAGSWSCTHYGNGIDAGLTATSSAGIACQNTGSWQTTWGPGAVVCR